MKSRLQYQIHALIGWCHLHSKKKAAYSITLKMGSKHVASTEYKTPQQDEINYNTELILKIDKHIYESTEKLTLIVSMLTDEKDKKIVGSILVKYKTKGSQCIKISQCSCKDKNFEVNIEFQVVGLQTPNNNQIDNKFQGSTPSDMKQLGQTFTISKEKDLLKSSRAKKTLQTRSSNEKTEIKVSRAKNSKPLKKQMASNISTLTAKNSPSIFRDNQISNQQILVLKESLRKAQDQILQRKLRQNQVRKLYDELQMLGVQNQFLIELLKIQDEKNSAAISYIEFLISKLLKFFSPQTQQNERLKYIRLFQTVKAQFQGDDTMTSLNQMKNKPKKNLKCKISKDSVKVDGLSQEVCEQKIQELSQMKNCLENENKSFLSEISDYKKKIQYLQVKMQGLQNENENLGKQLDMLKKDLFEVNTKIKQKDVLNQELEWKIKQLQKSMANLGKQKQQHYCLVEELEKDKQKIQDKILWYEQEVCRLKQTQTKYLQFLENQQQYQQLQEQNLVKQLPKTPLQSQISPTQDSKSKCEPEQSRIMKEMIIQITDCIPNDSKLISQFDGESQDQKQFHRYEQKSQNLLSDMKRNTLFKYQKKFSVPQYQNHVQKYNYDYDIDSVNYFNNFQGNRQRLCDLQDEQSPQQI